MDQDQEPWQHYPSTTHCWPRPGHYSRRYDRFVSASHVITTSSKDRYPFWTLLWRKLKKDNKNKKKTKKGSLMMFQCCYCCDTDSVSKRFGYDSISYLQNFDQGDYNNRDDLGHSFSARFAVPSTVFDDKN